MELVTGRKGSPHVTSQQDRMKNQGIFGADSYILNTGKNLAPEVQSSNEIRIRDGAIMVQGALGAVKVNTYDPVTIQNGNQGMKRIDLICWQYTYEAERDTESADWIVIQGTPAEADPQQPEHISGSIQEGDAVVQVPVFAVHLDGINVTGVDVLIPVIMTNADLSDKIEQFDIISSGELTMYPDREQTFGKFIKKSGKLVEIWINAGVTKQIENGHKIADIPKGYWPGTTFNIFVPTGTKDYPVTVNSNGSVTALAAIPVSTTIRIHEFYFTK